MVFSDSDEDEKPSLDAATIENLDQMQLRFGSDMSAEMAFSCSMPCAQKQEIFKLSDQSLRR